MPSYMLVSLHESLGDRHQVRELHPPTMIWRLMQISEEIHDRDSHDLPLVSRPAGKDPHVPISVWARVVLLNSGEEDVAMQG